MTVKDASVRVGETADFMEGVAVTTPAGEDLFREGVVASDPIVAEARARVRNAEPNIDDYGSVVRIPGLISAINEVKPPAVQQTQDTADIEFTSVALSITTIGNTTIFTPAPGKRVRLHWIYAINDPVSNSSTKITVKIGSQTFYVAWAISKRQRFTGEVDAPLIIHLSQPGDVAVTAFVEEV